MSDTTTLNTTEGTASGESPVKAVLRPRGRGETTKAMPKNDKNMGICSTCIHCGSCALCANHSMPVWHCEEFEVEVGSVGAQHKDLTAVRAGCAETVKDSGTRKHMGLCMNCVHRDTCTFPRPEGGVWRCNEYE